MNRNCEMNRNWYGTEKLVRSWSRACTAYLFSIEIGTVRSRSMSMMLEHVLVLSAYFFSIGIYGLITSRNMP
jgi:hypothetical protein